MAQAAAQKANEAYAIARDIADKYRARELPDQDIAGRVDYALERVKQLTGHIRRLEERLETLERGAPDVRPAEPDRRPGRRRAAA